MKHLRSKAGNYDVKIKDLKYTHQSSSVGKKVLIISCLFHDIKTRLNWTVGFCSMAGYFSYTKLIVYSHVYLSHVGLSAMAYK